MQIIYNAIAELSFDDQSSILHMRMLEGAIMNLLNTKRHFQTITEITKNENYLALIDATNYFSVTPEALKFASSNEALEKRIAAAHYNSVLANKETINYFNRFYKPSSPLQIFDKKEEAIKWLMSFKK